MRASLFITCYNDTLFPETGRAVVRLLERLGVELERVAERGRKLRGVGDAPDADRRMCRDSLIFLRGHDSRPVFRPV